MTGDEDEAFSILIATDNHLGFQEKDVIRGDDSFRAFEEILQHAVNQKVDMILLGGDLFHDNKPTRTTVFKAMTLLRKYCFGDNPIEIEFLSNQKANFHTSQFSSVNYEDPNLNVSIPVFSIHGNHDDPSGPDGLCALDLLSASGVINYFGKTSSVDEIEIAPLLMRKGNTKLAIYGLGSVRDERLHRMFLNKKVKVLRPEADADDWFNIFVIHQNHVKRGTQNTSYIPEEFLPDYMDMVLWGHEHDCIPELKLNEEIGAYVLQPGSSVATSLCHGETEPKHCFKLQIRGKEFKLDKIPLTTVRPFIFKDVSLIDEDVTGDKEMHTLLQYHVDEMIERAAQMSEHHPDGADILPLIRLRYEYSGSTIPVNSAKFGVEYTGRVANPRDILNCSKKKNYASYDSKSGGTRADMQGDDGDEQHARKISPGALALEMLQESGKKMNVLLERGLCISCEDYVDKLENDSVSEYISFAMESCQKYLRMKTKRGDDLTEKLRVRKALMSKDDVSDEMDEARKRWEQRRMDKQARGEDDNMDSDNDSDPELLGDNKRGRGRGRARAARGTRGTTRGTRGARGGRGSRGGKATGKAPSKTKGNLDSFFSGTSVPTTTPRSSGRSTKNTKSTNILDFTDSDED